ncbi:MAG: GNAT family N-acetyltransferase [Rubrivivax sp.]|nr:GNAT family N-acetyltransferase [Rubrivivax sp.]
MGTGTGTSTSASDAVHIRRARLEDAEAFAATMSDPAVLPDLLQLPYVDAADWRARLADSLKPGEPRLMLVAEVDGVVVGNAGLAQGSLQMRRRHAMGLGIAVNATHWRRGVGQALMTALIDWADNWAGVLRIELQVFTDNAAAQALYQRHGFVVEGRHRGFALRDGVYADVVSMARLHPAPPRWN